MRLFSSIVQNCLLMSLLAALFLLLRVPLSRKVKPRTSYILGLVIAAGLVIPFRPALPISFNVPVLMSAPAYLRENLPETIPYDYDFAEPVRQESLPNAQAADQPADLQPAAKVPMQMDYRWIAACIWLGGILVGSAHHIVRHFRFRSWVSRWRSEPGEPAHAALSAASASLAIAKPPRLWQCDCIKSPMLVGLFRPTILLPNLSFAPSELDMIIRHELIHHARHDLWYKALTLAAALLNWWNPLAHLMAAAISADCEMSCDDAVLGGADLSERKFYGETILSVITRQSGHACLSTYFYEGGIALKRRFSSMLMVKPRRTGTFAIVMCICLTIFTGSVFATNQTAAAPGAGQAISPTTGMLYPEGRDAVYRPILVEIENIAAARPQLALSLADVVYEYIMWGPGHTRYLALFNDYHPELVGGIRSSKTLGMSIRNSWDCPIVFAGGPNDDSTTSIYRFIAENEIPESMLFDSVLPADHAKDVFSRLTIREAPHNLVADLRLLVQTHWPEGADQAPHSPALPTLAFSDAPSRGESGAAEIIIPYEEYDYLVRYTYDVSAGHYKRWYNGVAQVDGITEQEIIASNVIVLYAELEYINNAASDPAWKMTGGGKLDAFIGGSYIQGSWQRNGEASAFDLCDGSGNPLLLAPGKTFIQIVPTDMEIHYR